ncbi:MAG: hypothetical protein LBG13_02655 [Holosporales bacterium]|jgi:hypothetical protein|nr:hypothetical protein [Holosporales bacterium]
MNKKLAILKRLLVAVSCIVLVSEGIVTKAEGSMTFDEEERKLSEEQQELEEKRKDLAQKMKDLAQKKKKEENRKKEEEKKQREAAKKRLEEEEKKRKEEEKKRKEEEKKNKAYSIVYQTMHKPAHVDNITIKIIEGYKVKVNVDAGTILGFFPSPFSRPFIAKESYSNTFDFTEEIELLRKNEDCNNIRDLILLVGKSFSSSKESIYSKEENKVRDTLAGLAESSLNRKQDQEIKNTKQNILFPKSITLSLGETAKYVKNLKPDTLRTYALDFTH